MTYVSWAAFHEGHTDSLYLEVLLPRLMEHIIITDGIVHSDIPTVPAVLLGKGGREVEEVAAEICETKEAFEIVFIHADTGGSALERNLHTRSLAYCGRAYEICEWPPARCVTLTPRHETEAWILADPAAVMGALGYNGDPTKIGLPTGARAAERHPDPKAVLQAAMRAVVGSRRQTARVEQLLPAIAQRQNIDSLRASLSFRKFETKLRDCLADLGCIS